MNVFGVFACVGLSLAAEITNFQMGTEPYVSDIIYNGVAQGGWATGTQLLVEETTFEAFVWLDVAEVMPWNGTGSVDSETYYQIRDPEIGGDAGDASEAVSLVFTCSKEGSATTTIDIWVEGGTPASVAISFVKECVYPRLNLNLVSQDLPDPLWFIIDGVPQTIDPPFESSELQNFIEMALSSTEDRISKLALIDTQFKVSFAPAMSPTVSWVADTPADVLVVDDPSILVVVYHCMLGMNGIRATGTLYLNIGWEDPVTVSYDIECNTPGIGWSSAAIWGFVFFWALVICLCCSMAAFWSDDATPEEKSSLLNTPAVPVGEGGANHASSGNPFDDPAMDDPASKDGVTLLDQESAYSRMSGFVANAIGSVKNRGPQDFQSDGFVRVDDNGGADAYHSQL